MVGMEGLVGKVSMSVKVLRCKLVLVEIPQQDNPLLVEDMRLVRMALVSLVYLRSTVELKIKICFLNHCHHLNRYCECTV